MKMTSSAGAFLKSASAMTFPLGSGSRKSGAWVPSGSIVELTATMQRTWNGKGRLSNGKRRRMAGFAQEYRGKPSQTPAEGLALPWLWGGLHHACTSQVPPMHLAYTSQSPPKHLACTSHAPRMYLALGGFARHFFIHNSSFCLRPRVFTISLPNTTPLPRLPWGGLGAPWTNPGHVLVP